MQIFYNKMKKVAGQIKEIFKNRLAPLQIKKVVEQMKDIFKNILGPHLMNKAFMKIN